MRQLVSLIVIVVSIAGCRPNTATSPYAKATVFFLGWDIMTRARLTPEDVRRLAPASFSTNDASNINSLVAQLRLDSLVPTDISNEDPRLVVDLVRKNGEEVTYFAGYFNLVAPASHHAHPIDEAFRARFSRGKAPKW